jgi:hypothetical protein
MSSQEEPSFMTSSRRIVRSDSALSVEEAPEFGGEETQVKTLYSPIMPIIQVFHSMIRVSICLLLVLVLVLVVGIRGIVNRVRLPRLGFREL